MKLRFRRLAKSQIGFARQPQFTRQRKRKNKNNFFLYFFYFSFQFIVFSYCKHFPNTFSQSFIKTLVAKDLIFVYFCFYFVFRFKLQPFIFSFSFSSQFLVLLFYSLFPVTFLLTSFFGLPSQRPTVGKPAESLSLVTALARLQTSSPTRSAQRHQHSFMQQNYPFS